MEGKIVKKTNGVNYNQEHPLYCNSCGKSFKIENGIMMEDAFEATKEWGYFSERDLEVHHFNLCEECYEKLISQFKIPVEIKKKIEAM